MAKFIFVSVGLMALACTSLAMPQNSPIKEESVESTLVMLPSDSGSADTKFFFFPFNFWNGFQPLPWIPLPGIQIPTTAAPGGDKDEDDDEDKDEDKDEDNKDEDDKDKDEDEGDEDKEEDEGNDDEEEE